MLVLVQFAFANLRAFIGPTSAGGPDWTLPPDTARPDFVRSFGALRRRKSVVTIRGSTWPSESWFAHAEWAIRLPELTADQFTHDGKKVVPRFGLRRLFSDGVALWRLEVGIGFEARSGLTPSQAMHLVHDLLQLPVRVRVQGELGPPAPLIQQGAALEDALTQACTFKSTPAAARPLKMRRGRAMVFIETNAATAGEAVTEAAASVPGARHFSIGAADSESHIDIDYATLRMDREDLPMVWMHSRLPDRAVKLSAVRTHLLRLHAEREVLTQVLRASKRKLLDETTPELERYLQRAQADLFAEKRMGVEQTQLQEIFAVYDEIAPAEKLALESVLGNRRQSKERTESLVGSYRGPDDRAIVVISTGAFTMNDNSVTIGGSNYGPINVAGTFVNTGKIIAGTQDSELKTALETLHDLTKKLAEQKPDASDKEQVANQAEALAKAAVAAKPDKSMLQVTGKGLIEAAKTVAGMAGPIATAVGAVLGILGVAL